MRDGTSYTLRSKDGIVLGASNGAKEFTLSLVSNGKGLFVAYVVNDSMEICFTEEDEGLITSIFDKDGDGEPDYRLIRDAISASTKKEIPTIVWEADTNEGGI